MILAWCSVIVFFVYCTVLVIHAVGYIRLRTHRLPPGFTPGERYSIVICARNESDTILPCLYSVIQQRYPKDYIELILVNDASTDDTLAKAEACLSGIGIPYRIVSNSVPLGKKRSLTAGIAAASHGWIITRDADTVSTSPYWLASIESHRQISDSNFIICPVSIRRGFGLLWAVQVIETYILQIFTGGSVYFKFPYLCSGANLAFSKPVYLAVNGYASHLQIASGDDVLFLEDAKRHPDTRISYLKDSPANAETRAHYSLKDLLSQKARWASKFRVNPNGWNTFFGFVVFVTNFVWLIQLAVGFLNPDYASFGLIFMVFKLLIDILLLFLADGFVKNKQLWLFVLPSGFIYPVYAVLVTFYAIFTKPEWKTK
ncbi:MAG: glycosyltransferase [Sediminibacterium sp.]|nr:glycosyltransferase [Sediminibacterium sp.]